MGKEEANSKRQSGTSQPMGVDQINRKGEAHLRLCQPMGEEEANASAQIVMCQPTGGGEAVGCYTPWCEDIALSRSLAEEGEPARPCYLPPPPHADGAAGRSSGSARQTTRRLNASPPPGVDGITRQPGATLLRPPLTSLPPPSQE
jgi:hypothetical protein